MMRVSSVYDEEPVYYCSRCLSLRIIGDGYYDYCDDCGSMNIKTCLIGEWENKRDERDRYRRRHYGR